MISDGGLGNQPQEQNARSTGKCTGSVRAMFVTFSKKFSFQYPFTMNIISGHSVQRKYFRAPAINTCPFPWFDLCTMKLEMSGRIWFGNCLWESLKQRTGFFFFCWCWVINGGFLIPPYQPFSHILLMHAFFRVVSICFAPYPTREGKQSPSHSFRTTFYIIAAVLSERTSELPPNSLPGMIFCYNRQLKLD